jgi:hypothetical protein
VYEREKKKRRKKIEALFATPERTKQAKKKRLSSTKKKGRAKLQKKGKKKKAERSVLLQKWCKKKKKRMKRIRIKVSISFQTAFPIIKNFFLITNKRVEGGREGKEERRKEQTSFVWRRSCGFFVLRE